jgi:hypothetical protein
MVQNYPFSGVMNLDDPDEVIPVIHNQEVRNVQWKGTAPNLRAENMAGTREKTNPFLINDGNNLTIGKFYDPIDKRIFTFNYRGDNNKAIYMYDTMLATWYRLVEQTVNADNDVLEFTQTPIINIDIIYGDNTQGNILCYTDSLGVPKKLNIQRALSGGYGTIKKSYLDIAKEPPGMPPSVIYENDASNTVNNQRKKLFKYKARWVFDDQDKSVTSSQSEVPIPLGAFDQSFDSDPTKNCRTAIVYQTGPANVRKVELLAAVSLGNVFSDFFLIASIDKSVSGLLDNDLATYLFYNDKAYNYIDVEESNQLFDWVPQTAGAQTLLNGNVLAYGNIKEGYPNLTSFSFGGNTSNVTGAQGSYYYGNLFSTLVTSQSGDSGFGSGNIHIVVRGIIAAPAFSLDTYTVYMTDGTNISYTLNTSDDAAAIIEGLRVNAITKGYTIVSVGNNDLVVERANTSLARSYITSNYSYNSLSQTSLNAYDWLGKHGWALLYLDGKDKTNGAVYTDGFSVSSASYTELNSPNDKPLFNASIYHVPPDWATHFQWLRTKDLKKSKFQQWVTDRTYKDTNVTSGMIRYAYLSIESLNAFVVANPGSPLGYAFSPGDRITFFKRYNPDTTTASLYGNSRDYEIIASLENPTINGQERTGQFIKIILPSTDGNFDFGDGFANYFVELYTPAQSVANGLDVYYEFGERYAIGNPGTSTRFHQGELQNQTTNYATPATFEFSKGDFYIRQRSVQAGNVYTYNVINGQMTAGRFLFGLNFVGSTYTDPNITAQSVPFANISGNTPSGGIDPGSDTRWFLKSIPNTTFKYKANLIINFTTSVPGDTWRIFLLNRYNEREYLATFDASSAGTYPFQIDINKTLEDDRVFLIAEGGERPLNVFSSIQTASIDHVISQVMIDQNFSDYFPSAVNSNGRAYIYDENANQVTYATKYRFSLAYQADTNINQSNRFYPQNFDNVDRRFGAIKRMLTWDRMLTFFQERKCGQAGVYQKFVSDNDGGTQLITTSNIITDNNVQYYAGNYGVGNQSDSVVQSGFVYYFVDPVKGVICRLSRDGVTVLSEVYKTQTYAGLRVSQYLTDRNYTFGGRARITGTFNIRKDNTGEYLCVLQPWTLSSQSFAGETIAFDEVRNAFSGFYSFAPEQIICAENVLYSFRNGKMYIHDNTTSYNTFYGQFYESTITRVFNAGLVEKKNWISLTEVASAVWNCPEITTNNMSYGSTPQSSNLLENEFVNQESNFSACFLGDLNSIGSAGNGESLKGNLIKIKFRATGAASFVTLSAVNLYFTDSPFTNR